jgi:hypothetical protein
MFDPEQAAEALIDNMPYRWTGNHDCGDVPDLSAFHPLLVHALLAAHAAGMREERERCVQVCDREAARLDHYDATLSSVTTTANVGTVRSGNIARHIAVVIRALPDQAD